MTDLNISLRPKSRRISITVPEDDLELWERADSRKNLSAFIREAVNEYIKIQDPDRKRTIFDLFIEQRQGLEQIFQKLGRIEGDLFEVTAAMAQKDIYPEPEKKIIEKRILDYIGTEEFRINLIKWRTPPK